MSLDKKIPEMDPHSDPKFHNYLRNHEYCLKTEHRFPAVIYILADKNLLIWCEYCNHVYKQPQIKRAPDFREHDPEERLEDEECE
jgi:hypothetical protein